MSRARIDHVQLRDIQLPQPLYVASDAWQRPLKPQPGSASVRISYPSQLISQAAEADAIGYTLNYSTIYRSVVAELTPRNKSSDQNAPSASEHQAFDIVEIALRTANAAHGELQRQLEPLRDSHKLGPLGGTIEASVHLPKAILRAAGGLTCLIVRQNTPTAGDDELDARVTLKIDGVRCHCIVGINPHERLEKQAVELTLSFSFGLKDAECKKIRLCYQEMTKDIAEAVDASSFQTVEALAVFAAKRAIVTFGMKEITVRVEKPSALAFVAFSGIEITRTATDFPIGGHSPVGFCTVSTVVDNVSIVPVVYRGLGAPGSDAENVVWLPDYSGMYTSSPSCKSDFDNDLLPVPSREGKSPNPWLPQEDLTVFDVFAPQTPKCVKEVNQIEAHHCVENALQQNVPSTSAGFRMRSVNVSPTRKGTDRKKKKNKKNLAMLNNLDTAIPDYFKDARKTVSSPLNSTSAAPSTPGSRRPSPHRGISALSLKLEALNVDNVHPSGSEASQKGSEVSSNGSDISDSDQTEILTTYEIPLEHDFVSPDLEEGETKTRAATKDLLNRKMSANDFEPLTCLGKGTFGTVLLVKQKMTGTLYAQKQFRKASLTVHKRLVEQTKTERTVLESVNRHPFVVKLFYAFQDHEKLYLILEYAQGGELFTHLAMERMFTEEAASFYMAEMVLALEHLHHTVGVIYRDLKPENCLLDAEGHLLLTDFGLSKVAINDDDRCNSSSGTIEYMAPEVVQGKSYGKACDWWSLGALGFDLLTGSPPFKGNNHAKITERILKQKLALPYYLGPDAKDLLTRLLRKEPSKRLGYHMPKDMATIKGHRFFRKIDWKALERRELDPPIKPVITDPALAENFSADFTSLPLSPTVQPNFGLFSKASGLDDSSHEDYVAVDGANSAHENLFGGFSFVAPSSLFESRFAL
ncbi:serine/threonine protein kinase psk1 [Myotisia sp. PD_48]|nr:serine/threonine protein kinase psk1 [Myotisia sp. PD_48]